MANSPRKISDAEIKARQSAAGRFGFVFGCIAAIAAIALNLWRMPSPWTAISILLAVLMALLNVPLGIAVGLIGERYTRPDKGK